MQLPQVRLQSQFAQIGLRQEMAQIQIEQPKATQHIEQPHATIRISTTPSRLMIDQTKAFQDTGIKSAKVAIAESAQKGKQGVLEGMARRTQQGEQLMKIENGGNPLVHQAIQNGHRPEKQFNIGWMPSHFSVDIDYQPAEVNIQATPRAPIIQNTPNKPIINYQAGGVETTVQQPNTLDVDFEHLYFKGINFEMKI